MLRRDLIHRVRFIARSSLLSYFSITFALRGEDQVELYSIAYLLSFVPY